MNKWTKRLITLGTLMPAAAGALEYEKVGKALNTVLGNPKQVFKKKYSVDGKDYDLYYSKDAAGNPSKFASVQTAVFKPDCTHTWVVGMKARPEPTVEQIRVVEMKCVTYTEPARKTSFLSQFEGKKMSDVKTLDKTIGTVATATYTGQYTTEAVQRSLKLASQFKP